MKRFGWKIALIIGSTLLGLYSMYPPKKQLKLGIDLSGGTILVYEVDRKNVPSGFNMDDLISALKKRADPEGVKEIPIRNVGPDRIEIILPQATPEEVEEVKKMLTDVGMLEFRILANRKHTPEDVIARALNDPKMRPPARFDWRGWARAQPARTRPLPRIRSPTWPSPGRKTYTPARRPI